MYISNCIFLQEICREKDIERVDKKAMELDYAMQNKAYDTEDSIHM